MEEKAAKERTTVNLKKEVYDKLHETAQNENISPNTLMQKALKMLIPKIANKKFSNRTIKYQSESKEWKPQHISMTEIEYDWYMDIKKVIRISFSFLVTIAINKYCNKKHSDENKNECQITGYYKQLIEMNNMRIYTYCWGIPDQEIVINIPQISFSNKNYEYS